MTNIKTTTQGNILTITIDVSEDHGPSASGKTNIVASTHGFIRMDNVISLSVNVIRNKA